MTSADAKKLLAACDTAATCVASAAIVQRRGSGDLPSQAAAAVAVTEPDDTVRCCPSPPTLPPFVPPERPLHTDMETVAHSCGVDLKRGRSVSDVESCNELDEVLVWSPLDKKSKLGYVTKWCCCYCTCCLVVLSAIAPIVY